MRALSPQQQVVVATLPPPTSALAGAVVRLATDNRPYWCDGAAWFCLQPQITVATTAPASPALNDLWLQI